MQNWHDHIATINLTNEEQMATIESVHYPNEGPLIRRSKDRERIALAEGKARVTKSTAIDECDLAAEKRSAAEHREPSREAEPCRTCLRNEVDRIRGIAIQLISDAAARRLI